MNLITILCESHRTRLGTLAARQPMAAHSRAQGQFVVDSGDMLQHISNGRLKSTTHRVTNPDNSRERRFSMPFFVHPRPEVDLTPLAKSVAASGGQAKYDSLTAREFLEKRLEENWPQASLVVRIFFVATVAPNGQLLRFFLTDRKGALLHVVKLKRFEFVFVPLQSIPFAAGVFAKIQTVILKVFGPHVHHVFLVPMPSIHV